MMPVKIKNNLGKFVSDKERKLYGAMRMVLTAGAAEASMYTPIATSNLINSQMAAVDKEGEKIVGRVAYTASYAKYVHDPDVKQNFRRASAKKQFLKLGFEQSKPLIDRIVKEALKT